VRIGNSKSVIPAQQYQNILIFISRGVSRAVPCRTKPADFLFVHPMMDWSESSRFSIG
jgi:hypothetical protein